MNVKIIVGASHAYACISGDTFSMDIQLPGGKSAEADLRLQAAEFRKKAEQMLIRAERCEQAAAIIESTKFASAN